MPITVDIDWRGTVAEFPDGTPDDVIDQSVRRDFFQDTPQLHAPPEAQFSLTPQQPEQPFDFNAPLTQPADTGGAWQDAGQALVGMKNDVTGLLQPITKLPIAAAADIYHGNAENLRAIGRNYQRLLEGQPQEELPIDVSLNRRLEDQPAWQRAIPSGRSALRLARGALDPVQYVGDTFKVAGRGVTAIVTDLANEWLGDSSDKNLRAFFSQGTKEPLPTVAEIKGAEDEMTWAPKFMANLSLGISKDIPKFAASYGLGALGASEALAAAIPFSVDEKGNLDPVNAAIMAGLPFVSAAGRKLGDKTFKTIFEEAGTTPLYEALRDPALVAEALARKVNIPVPFAQQAAEKIGEQGAVLAYLMASTTPEILATPESERGAALRDAFASNLALVSGFQLPAIVKLPGYIKAERENQARFKNWTEQREMVNNIMGAGQRLEQIKREVAPPEVPFTPIEIKPEGENNATENQIGTPGEIPAVIGKPVVTGTEIKPPSGTPLRRGAGEEGLAPGEESTPTPAPAAPAVNEVLKQQFAAITELVDAGKPINALELERIPGAVKAATAEGYEKQGDVYAKKTTPAAEGVPEDYRMQHRPNADGPESHDLLSTDLAPRDIYENPQFYTGEPGSVGYRESLAALRKIRGNPESEVTVYRSSPKKELREGDWISFSKQYSKQHGMADNSAEDVPVHAFKVKAKDVRWAGDMLEEFGYYPKKVEPPPAPSPAEAKPIEQFRKRVQELISGGMYERYAVEKAQKETGVTNDQLQQVQKEWNEQRAEAEKNQFQIGKVYDIGRTRVERVVTTDEFGKPVESFVPTYKEVKRRIVKESQKYVWTSHNEKWAKSTFQAKLSEAENAPGEVASLIPQKTPAEAKPSVKAPAKPAKEYPASILDELHLGEIRTRKRGEADPDDIYGDLYKAAKSSTHGKKFFSPDGRSPLEVLNDLRENRILGPDDDIGEMFRRMSAASDERSNVSMGRTPEARQERFGKAVDLRTKKNVGTPVRLASLNPGDKFKMEGAEFEVTHLDEEGVTLKDDLKFGTLTRPASEIVPVDKGILERRRQSIAGEDFNFEPPESVAQQGVRLRRAKEQDKAAQLQADREAAKATKERGARERLAAPIGGDLGTAGQGALFVEPGQQELFRPPAPSVDPRIQHLRDGLGVNEAEARAILNAKNPVEVQAVIVNAMRRSTVPSVKSYLEKLVSEIGEPETWGEVVNGPPADPNLKDHRPAFSKALYEGVMRAEEIRGQSGARSLATESKLPPLGVNAVVDHLILKRGAKPGAIKVLFDESSKFNGEAIGNEDGFIGIELNAAKIRSIAELDWVLEHELAEGAAWPDKNGVSPLKRALETLTQQERDGIAADLQRLGYPERNRFTETNARGTQALVEAWRGRNWFEKLVGVVSEIASRIGLPMTRLAAERAAVRAMGQAMSKAMQTAGAKRIGIIQAINAKIVPPWVKEAFSIVAHHGTPHEVDRFTTAKIGTGEGAQVYGWGLYMAENPEVAKSYRAALAGREIRVDGVPQGRLNLLDPAHAALDQVARYGQGKAEQLARETLRAFSEAGDEYNATYQTDVIKAVESLRNRKVTTEGGNEYTVSLDVKPEELLDWDKPLSEQSPAIRRIVEKVRPGIMSHVTGEKLYDAIRHSEMARLEPGDREHPNSQTYAKRASEYLNSLGIKGIRYLDQGSRRAFDVQYQDGKWLALDNSPLGYWRKGSTLLGEFDTKQEAEAAIAKQQTSNYVIFDESVIKITHKNGQPVTLEQAMAEPVEVRRQSIAEDITEQARIAEADKNKEQAKITYATGEVQRAAQPKIKELESATQRLSALKYDTAQYSEAVRSLNEWLGRGLHDAKRAGWEEGDYPTIKDPLFVEKLEQLGALNADAGLNRQAVDPVRAKETQQRVLFEDAARRLTDMRSAQDQNAKEQQILKAYPEKVKELQDAAKRRANAMAKLERKTVQMSKTLDPVRNNVPRTDAEILDELRARSDEHRAVELRHPEDQARERAYFNPFVQRVFVEPLRALQSLAETFRNDLRTFRGVMAAGTAEQKGIVARNVIRSLKEFQGYWEQFKENYDSRRASLLKAIGREESQITGARLTSAMQEVLLRDALATLRQGEGLPGSGTTHTGTAQGLNVVDQLIGRVAALQTFVEHLKKMKEVDAQTILQELLHPTTDVPGLQYKDFNFGVNRETFDLIFQALKDKKFNGTVAELDKFSRIKMSQIPAVQLRNIPEKLNEGSPDEAKAIYEGIRDKALNTKSQADAAEKIHNRKMYDLTLDLQALDHIKDLFESVTGKEGDPRPEWDKLYADAVRESGFALPMRTSNSQGITYKAFGDQPEVSITAKDSSVLSEKTVKAISDWWNKADDYVRDYYDARQDFESGGNHLLPEQRGFDFEIVRGIEAARDYRDMETRPDINLKMGRIQRTWWIRWTQGNFYFKNLFLGSRIVQAVTGRGLETAMQNTAHGFAEGDKIGHEFSDIPHLRYKALRSHPEIGSLETYAYEVQGSMARLGRRFEEEGRQLKVGTPLPMAGKVVTAEDMAYYKRDRQMQKAIRDRISERTAAGGIEVTAFGKPVGRAPAVSPGQAAMTRHAGVRADELVDGLARAGKDAPPIGDDVSLGADSTHPVVQFWNSQPDSIVSHILDAGAADRTLRQDDLMLRASIGLRQKLNAQGHAFDIRTVEDAVNALSSPDVFPVDQVSNPKQYVRTKFLDELEQVQRKAETRNTELPAEQKRAGNLGGMAWAKEFTHEANRLEFPSNWYDYGAVTDGQMATSLLRANYENILSVYTAFDRARVALKQELLSPAGRTWNYETRQEAEKVLEVLKNQQRGFQESVEKPYDFAEKSLLWKFVKAGVSSILSAAQIGWRNFTFGQMAAYAQAGMLNRTMGLLELAHTTGNIAKISTNLVYDLIGNTVGKAVLKISPETHKFITGIGRKMMEAFMLDLSPQMARVHELGYSRTNPLMQDLRRSWDSARTYQTELDRLKGEASPVRETAKRVAAAAAESISSVLNRIGQTPYDWRINAVNVGKVGSFYTMLERAAPEYALTRDMSKPFNPNDPYWKLGPDEFSHRLTKAGRIQNTARWNDILQDGGMSLERLFYDYNKARHEGKPADLMAREQFDAFSRAYLKRTNASDRLNRPLVTQYSNLGNKAMLLQGYGSRTANYTADVLSGVYGQSFAAKAMHALPAMMSLAIGATIIGLQGTALTEQGKRRLFGIQSKNTTILDKEFWTSGAAAAQSIAFSTMAALPVWGDLAMLITNQTYGGKGWDPTSRILPLNMLNSAVTLVRSLWGLGPNVWQDWPVPVDDFVKQYGGFFGNLLNMASPYLRGIQQARNATNIFYRSLVGQGLKPETKGAVGTYTMTPVSGIKAKLLAAAMNGDQVEMSKQAARLVQYHAELGDQHPEKSAQRDYESTNPILRAAGGKRLTEEQYGRVMAGLSHENRQVVQQALTAWQQGEAVLGANIREPYKIERGGGAQLVGGGGGAVQREPGLGGGFLAGGGGGAAGGGAGRSIFGGGRGVRLATGGRGIGAALGRGSVGRTRAVSAPRLPAARPRVSGRGKGVSLSRGRTGKAVRTPKIKSFKGRGLRLARAVKLKVA